MFKESALANLFILLIPIIGILMGMIIMNPKFYIILIYSVGFVLFFIAKCTQFKKGRWLSFGSKEMEENFKNLYVAGWSIMGFAIFIALLLTIIS